MLENYSQDIANFLTFMREAEQKNSMALADNKEADDETQDILHAIEFGDYDARRTAKLVRKLSMVRQKRRWAKDTIEATRYIVDWGEENRAFLKSLERLLGDVRKVERRAQNRLYAPRTDIMESD